MMFQIDRQPLLLAVDPSKKCDFLLEIYSFAHFHETPPSKFTFTREFPYLILAFEASWSVSLERPISSNGFKSLRQFQFRLTILGNCHFFTRNLQICPVWSNAITWINFYLRISLLNYFVFNADTQSVSLQRPISCDVLNCYIMSNLAADPEKMSFSHSKSSVLFVLCKFHHVISFLNSVTPKKIFLRQCQ